MFDAENSDFRNLAHDPLSFPHRLANLSLAAPRRANGELLVRPLLGTLEFVQMPPGRPSYWHCRRTMPDSRYALDLEFEVEHDDEPGADHEGCAIAICRLQVQEAVMCTPLIRSRLRELRPPRNVRPSDLVLTAIRMPSRPLPNGEWDLHFRHRSRTKRGSRATA